MIKKSILLTVSYDGTNFYGWQRQNEKRTVQKELEKAISSLFNANIKIRGTSRTDKGVHALGQIVKFEQETTIPMKNLPRAINSYLKVGDIIVTNAIYVDENFHTQYNVYKKSYEYKIYNNEFMNPMYKNYAKFVRGNIDIQKMKQGASYFLGEHDFKAFCASGSQIKTTIREIYEFDISKKDKIITLNITGNGFLYNMVRIITGTLIEVGLGKRELSDIPKIIKSLDRTIAGETAGAEGLILKKIFYKL